MAAFWSCKAGGNDSAAMPRHTQPWIHLLPVALAGRGNRCDRIFSEKSSFFQYPGSLPEADKRLIELTSAYLHHLLTAKEKKSSTFCTSVPYYTEWNPATSPVRSREWLCPPHVCIFVSLNQPTRFPDRSDQHSAIGEILTIIVSVCKSQDARLVNYKFTW